MLRYAPTILPPSDDFSADELILGLEAYISSPGQEDAWDFDPNAGEEGEDIAVRRDRYGHEDGWVENLLRSVVWTVTEQDSNIVTQYRFNRDLLLAQLIEEQVDLDSAMKPKLMFSRSGAILENSIDEGSYITHKEYEVLAVADNWETLSKLLDEVYNLAGAYSEIAILSEDNDFEDERFGTGLKSRSIGLQVEL